jgi:hypothetical protein
MRLNPKSLAFALGAAWGGAILLTGVAHQFWPSYGGAFLDLAASIYPGFHVGGFGQVIVGTLYGTLDGAVCGAIVAWLYNMVDRSPTG